MSETSDRSDHEFRLVLPNGFRVEIAGDGEFVKGVYGDTKKAATEIFQRFVSDVEAPPALLPAGIASSQPAEVAALPSPPPAAAGATAAAPRPPSKAEEKIDDDDYFGAMERFQEYCAARSRSFKRSVMALVRKKMGELEGEGAGGPAGEENSPPPQPPRRRSHARGRLVVCAERPGEEFTLEKAIELSGVSENSVRCCLTPTGTARNISAGGFHWQWAPPLENVAGEAA